MFEFQFFQFVTSHPTLRKFVGMTPILELDAEFPLKPKEISFQDNLDPKLIDRIEILKKEFLSKTPGLYCIYCINNVRIEMNIYHKEKFILPNGIFYKLLIK